MLQVSQMTRMQQIEHAVGEDDRLPGCAQPLDEANRIGLVHQRSALNVTFDENSQR